MDDDQDQHKTMITQLTELDDHALDEQAGLFMHPRKKSLKGSAAPRPLSQPFFQPHQVFPDVLNVSAMVERQEQKGQYSQDQAPPTLQQTSPQNQQQSSQSQPQNEQEVRDQRQQQQAQQQTQKQTQQQPQQQQPQQQSQSQQQQQQQQHGLASNDNDDDHQILGNKSSGAVSTLSYETSTALPVFTHEPHSLASQASRAATVQLSVPGAETAPTTPAAGTGGTGRLGLRSVSLTRMVYDSTDGILKSLGADSLASGLSSGHETQGTERKVIKGSQGPVDIGGQALRQTPVGTPIDENDRQLSIETSKTSKTSKRVVARGDGGNATGGNAGGGSGRLFSRRLNSSNKGSDDDDSDENEQFIYRHSRSSLRVNPIPEEDYDERDQAVPSRRKSNRQRMSAHIGADRRQSAGLGRTVPAAQVPTHYIGYSSTTAHTHSISSGPISVPSRSSRRTPRPPRSRHRFSILTQSNNEYGESSEESGLDAEPAAMRSTYNGYSRRNSRRFHSNAYYGSSEDFPEVTPLFRRNYDRPHKRTSSVAQVLRAIGATLVALGSLFALMLLFSLTSQPLGDVEALKLSNILATEKELLFILHVRSTNPNIREVLIERAEIGVFAAEATRNSTTPDDGSQLASNETEPAILLGNVFELSDPIRFAPASLRHSTTDTKTTQISIHHPGASLDDSDESGSDASRWRQLLKGPYDLTIRGTLQYTLWQRNYAARICISKLANSPTDNSTNFITAKGLSCDDFDDGDNPPITLPRPPAPPFLWWLIG